MSDGTDFASMADDFDSMQPDEQAKVAKSLSQQDMAALDAALDAKHSKPTGTPLKTPAYNPLQEQPEQPKPGPEGFGHFLGDAAGSLVNGALGNQAGKIQDNAMAAIRHPIDYLSGLGRMSQDMPAGQKIASGLVPGGMAGMQVLQHGVPRASDVVGSSDPGADSADAAFTHASQAQPSWNMVGQLASTAVIPGGAATGPVESGLMATGDTILRNTAAHGMREDDLPEAAMSGIGGSIMHMGGEALGKVWRWLKPSFGEISDWALAHHLGIPQEKVTEMKAAGEMGDTMGRIRDTGALKGGSVFPNSRETTHVNVTNANADAQSELGASHGAIDLTREALGQEAPAARDVSDFVKDSAFNDVQNGNLARPDLDRVREIADERIIPSGRGRTIKEALASPERNAMGQAGYSPRQYDPSLALPDSELLSKNGVPKMQADNSGLRYSSDMNGERMSQPSNDQLASEMWWKYKGEPPTNNSPGSLSQKDPWYRPPPNSNSAAGQREVGALELHTMARDLETGGKPAQQNVADSYRALIGDQVGGISREDPRIAAGLGFRIEEAEKQVNALGLAKSSMDNIANPNGPGYKGVAGELPKAGIMKYPYRALNALIDRGAAGGSNLTNWLSKATMPESIAKYVSSPMAAMQVSKAVQIVAQDKNHAVMHWVMSSTNPEYNKAFLAMSKAGNGDHDGNQ